MKKLICDTNVFYPDEGRKSDLNYVINMTGTFPSPTLGNCAELLMSYKKSEAGIRGNLQARLKLKSYKENLILSTPYSILDEFLSDYGYKFLRTVPGNLLLWNVFRGNRDQLFAPSETKKFKEDEIEWLGNYGAYIKQVVRDFWNYCKKVDRRKYGGRPAETEQRDYISIFLFTFTYNRNLPDDILDSLRLNFPIFSEFLRQKFTHMLREPEEKFKPNDLYDVTQFLYLEQGDYFITCESQVLKWINKTPSKLLYEGSDNLALYEIMI